MMAERLRVRGLHQRFGAPVLRGVDLTLEAGRVHALVGGNGAGKSTLANILAGLLAPDGGEMQLDGRPYAPRSRREGEAAGVTLMLQELHLLPTLSIAENLFLHRLPRRFGFVQRAQLHRNAEAALARVGLETLDPATLASGLGVGQQQLVVLARALAGECRVIILDEPTAALSAAETALLFAHITRLRAAGTAILYISHRLDDLRTIADTISVLRDGKRVATRSATEDGVDDLLGLMSGAPTVPTAGAAVGAMATATTGAAADATPGGAAGAMSGAAPAARRGATAGAITGTAASARPARTGAPGPVVLRVSGLQSGRAVRDVTFELRGGEILGFYGLVGAGRTEMLHALFGTRARQAGTMAIGHPLRAVSLRTPADAVRAGLALVPEDRRRDGLCLPLGLRENAMLASLRGIVPPRDEASRVQRICDRLAVRRQSLEQPVATLSGGNQQKIVLARWLLRDPAILLLDEPTRGVDVAAKAAIHALLRDLAAARKALIVASSDLSELLSLCDRIAVMSAGRLIETVRADETSIDALTRTAFQGHLAHDAAVSA